MKDYNAPIETMFEALYLSPSPVIIADSQVSGCPFIFVNKAFENLTGYKKEEILGENGSFLHGEDTEKEALEKIRQAIEEQKPVTCVLKNYKKGGELFYNELTIQPIYDKGRNLYSFGTQKDVTESVQMKEKMKKYEKIIEQLTAPIIPISATKAVLPIIGDMTKKRMDRLVAKSLHFLQEEKVETLIIDFTGLIIYHEGIVEDMEAFYKMLRLIGIQVAVTGLSPRLVQQIDISRESLEKVITFHSVSQALKYLREKVNN